MADPRGWIGRTETVTDDLSAAQASAVHATLDLDGPPPAAGDALPPLWHWCWFLPRAPQHTLGEDGHPALGGFMPPLPLPRRMFAGARLAFHRPLRLGVPAVRVGEIRDVTQKRGRSGALAFVTVRYRYEQAGACCMEEEQDIVYREPGAAVAPPVPAPLPALPDDTWSRTVRPDPRLLFRFSALTFNAHRIHYDRDYARDVEGYPGLVVHGPLTALLLAELVRAHASRPMVRFAFRGQAPLFDIGPVRLVGRPAGERVSLEAQGPDGRAALAAEAELAAERMVGE